MSTLEMNDKLICFCCGTAFTRRYGNFSNIKVKMYAGAGYLPYCKECVENIYQGYFQQCGNQKDAVRQMCRKLDLFWDDPIYNRAVESVNNKQSKSIMTGYIAILNQVRYAGMSYDNTLMREDTMWSFSDEEVLTDNQQSGNAVEVTDDVIEYWGTGLPKTMYAELEQRKRYWTSRLPEDMNVNDVGVEALLRQLCTLEIDINRGRAAGKSVDKLQSSFTTMLGAMNLKPQQKVEQKSGRSAEERDLDKTPLGVWAKRIEDDHPIAEPAEEFKDVDGIGKYITTWFYGHIGKTLGLKNISTSLYDEAIAKMRIDNPDIEDEDDDEFLADLWGDSQ